MVSGGHFIIAAVNPDVVVWDPLKDTTWDDLNTDNVMANVLRTLCRTSRKLNPRRAVIIVHHAITGKGGAAKAAGMERASFGRNSKVLHSFCRAAINIVSAEEDDNRKLLFFCGKNNNGPEFKPFAAELGDDFIYRIDEHFDMEAWKEGMGIASKSSGGPAPNNPFDVIHSRLRSYIGTVLITIGQEISIRVNQNEVRNAIPSILLDS
jgi:hypothetical protein